MIEKMQTITSNAIFMNKWLEKTIYAITWHMHAEENNPLNPRILRKQCFEKEFLNMS